MIGMAPFPIGKNQHARTLLTENTNHLQAILPGILDAAVRNIESLAPGNFQNARRFRGFAAAVVHSSARSHFALRQVEDTGAMSVLGHLEQSSGAGLLNIIAVRSQGENVYGHLVIW
jgi:hypothetical protein